MQRRSGMFSKFRATGPVYVILRVKACHYSFTDLIQLLCGLVLSIMHSHMDMTMTVAMQSLFCQLVQCRRVYSKRWSAKSRRCLSLCRRCWHYDSPDSLTLGNSAMEEDSSAGPTSGKSTASLSLSHVLYELQQLVSARSTHECPSHATTLQGTNVASASRKVLRPFALAMAFVVCRRQELTFEECGWVQAYISS